MNLRRAFYLVRMIAFRSFLGAVALFTGVLTASGQIQTQPVSMGTYNPDADANGTILTPDLMQLLTVWGTDFEPMESQHIPAPEADVEALQAEVEALQSLVLAQQRTLNQVISAMQSLAPAGPFVYDRERGVWMTADPIEIHNSISAERMVTGRLECGSGHFGGSVRVGE